MLMSEGCKIVKAMGGGGVVRLKISASNFTMPGLTNESVPSQWCRFVSDHVCSGLSYWQECNYRIFTKVSVKSFRNVFKVTVQFETEGSGQIRFLSIWIDQK